MPALDLECAETQPPRGCCSATTGSSYYKYGQLGAPVEYRPPLLRGKPEIPWQRYVDASAAREAWSKRDSRRATVIVLASRETDSELWGCGRIRPQRSHSPSCPTILNVAILASSAISGPASTRVAPRRGIFGRSQAYMSFLSEV